MNLLRNLLTLDQVWSHNRKTNSHLLRQVNLILMIFVLVIILIVFAKEFFYNLPINDHNLFLLFLVFLFFNITSFLIQRGFIYLVSFAIVIFLLLFSFRVTLTFGVDFHIINIMFVFIILISSVLLTPKSSLFVFLIISLFISTIYFLDFGGYINTDASWKFFLPNSSNIVILLAIYALFALLSWISFKESELEMKKLKELHLKKLIEIAPLLDMGKLSTGLIHDVRNHLSVISFVLQNAQANNNVVNNLDLAFDAVDQIDSLSKLNSCELLVESEREVFDLNLEIKNVLSSLKNKSMEENVKIIFEPNQNYQLYADRTKLDQILMRLTLNAIESYRDIQCKDRDIFVKLVKKPRNLLIKIKDYGIGIKAEDISSIFNPYFTLKDKSESLGLSLYLSQKSMINAYDTKIKVESSPGVGSTFTLYIKNKFLLI